MFRHSHLTAFLAALVSASAAGGCGDDASSSDPTTTTQTTGTGGNPAGGSPSTGSSTGGTGGQAPQRYPVSVVVRGLEGRLVITLDGETIDITGQAEAPPTEATFPTELGDGASYEVSVESDPPLQTCALAEPTGVVAGAAVTLDIDCGNHLLFAGTDGTDGSEVYATDGTAAGTRRIAEIEPGSAGSFPQRFTSLGNGRWVFSAVRADLGRELFVTDGTAAGTTAVRDIRNGTDGSFPQDLVRVGARVLFSAGDDAGGAEVWRTDGTSAGTVAVSDGINPGPTSTDPSELTQVGEELFFVAEVGSFRRLYAVRDDDTVDLVRPNLSMPRALTAVDGRLFLAGIDLPVSGSSGSELWVSDGTETGTGMVADIRSGGTGSGPERLTAFDGRLVFAANDGLAGRELWVSDGTTAGTQRVADLTAGPAGSSISALNIATDGGALFIITTTTFGTELWVSDGTEAGTQRLTDIAPAGLSASFQAPSRLADGAVLLRTRDASADVTALWRTDGSVAGTTLVRAFAAPDRIESLLGHALDRPCYLIESAGAGGELWCSDGTPTGTSQVLDLCPGACGQNQAQMEDE
ncbi:MAG: ELWxxDGT repeat protein [Myxococcota bacterium]